MSDIMLENIHCGLLKRLSLHVRDQELFVLVGPSGAGKTTLLNALAGLIPHDGHILIDGIRVDRLPPYKRRLGYLFQDLLLFPHMSVKRNIETALRRKPMSKAERDRRVSHMIDLFRLKGLGDRLPDQLSGGEKQRVALARALASSPKVLLLDEPFSSLDFRTARYLRVELKRIHAHLKTTMIFVTHNLDEARELGDRMGVIVDGRLEQVGDIEKIMFQGSTSTSDFLEKP
ncbi:MAG: ABC transporter ATP-binding protein, partial [Deltaproteobacteria bacterium]